jgi:hypothetical protein
MRSYNLTALKQASYHFYVRKNTVENNSLIGVWKANKNNRSGLPFWPFYVKDNIGFKAYLLKINKDVKLKRNYLLPNLALLCFSDQAAFLLL